MSLFYLVAAILLFSEKGFSEVVKTYQTARYDDNCRNSSIDTCEQYAIGKIIDERSEHVWSRETCWDTKIEFGGDELRFPSVEAPGKQKRFPIHKFKWKQTTASNPDNFKLAAYAARCEEQRADNGAPVESLTLGANCLNFEGPYCVECPFGFQRNNTEVFIRLKNDSSASTSNVIQCEKITKSATKTAKKDDGTSTSTPKSSDQKTEEDQLLKDLIKKVKAELQACPAGFYRKLNERNQCVGKCMPNCRYCPNDKICRTCEVGFEVDYKSSACLPKTKKCEENTYLNMDRCQSCKQKTPNCNKCNGTTGECTGCKEGLILLKGQFSQKCHNPCQKGYFLNGTNGCGKCPPYCKTCHGPTDCTRCEAAYYEHELQNADGTRYVDCYDICPNGTYPSKSYPFRCLDCDPACVTCSGPLQNECFECKVIGSMDLQSMIPTCSSKTLLGQHLRDYGNFKEQEINELVAQIYGEGKKPLNPSKQLNRIYSYYYSSHADAENYFEGDETHNFKDRMYGGRRTEGCVEPSVMQACPFCKEDYHQFGHECHKQCPLGTTSEMIFDNVTKGGFNRCFFCPSWPRCTKCSAVSTFEANQTKPYNFTHPEYLANPFLLRFYCYENDTALNTNCDERSFFIDPVNGGCIACHKECDGCVGWGSHRCLKCKNFLDATGHCVKTCPKGYFSQVVNGQFKVCTAGSDEAKLSTDTFEDLTTGYPNTAVATLVPLAVGLVTMTLSLGITILLMFLLNKRSSKRHRRQIDLIAKLEKIPDCKKPVQPSDSRTQL